MATQHIRTFNSINSATSATGLTSPLLAKVVDGNNSRIISGVVNGQDTPIMITGSALNNLLISGLTDYLTFTCTEAGSIGMTCSGYNQFSSIISTPNIQYSKNNSEWVTWDYSNIPVNAGDIVKMKGVNSKGLSLFNDDTWDSCYSTFTMTGQIAASGNIMSLIDGLKDGTKIIPTYSENDIYNMCFYALFENCTSLTTAPELPATTLAPECYCSMFKGCTNLTLVELPALILQEGCYINMFAECTNLSYIKCLATNISAVGSTEDWVYLVNGSGQFVVPNNMRSAWNAKDATSGKPTNFVYVDA